MNDTLRRKLVQLMLELDEYFDGMADADHNGERFVPNQEMIFQVQIQEIERELKNEDILYCSACGEMKATVFPADTVLCAECAAAEIDNSAKEIINLLNKEAL